jgi:hypothetical protein
MRICLIDSNWIENRIRLATRGRLNWFFAGSLRGIDWPSTSLSLRLENGRTQFRVCNAAAWAAAGGHDTGP